MSVLRLAFVTTYDPDDVTSWSGIPKSMAAALRGAGCEVELVDVGYITLLDRALGRLRRRLPEREARVARRLAARIPSELLAFSPGSIAVAMRKGSVFWTDATFGAMVDFYPGAAGLSRRAIADGNALEQVALQNCAAAIYTSEWAARSAIDDYGADPAKVHVVAFGATVRRVPSREEIEHLVAAREEDPVLRLLFAGVDWVRKGGDKAIEVTRVLRDRGHDARLIVIGATPAVREAWVDVRGYLHGERDAAEYARAYQEARFLLLPTTAECFGVVFCDASAYAVPSIATRVGGVPSAVRDGINGVLLDRDSDPHAFADAIESTLPNYRALALASRQEYERRLNWEVAGQQATKIIGALT
jgi:glycosyltransferase involved in cell wall biosynthesis